MQFVIDILLPRLGQHRHPTCRCRRGDSALARTSSPTSPVPQPASTIVSTLVGAELVERSGDEPVALITGLSRRADVPSDRRARCRVARSAGRRRAQAMRRRRTPAASRSRRRRRGRGQGGSRNKAGRRPGSRRARAGCRNSCAESPAPVSARGQDFGLRRRLPRSCPGRAAPAPDRHAPASAAD